jgi:hypothetical protein
VRILVGLLAIFLCTPAGHAVAGRWVVNDHGECVRQWTPGSIARGPLAMVNGLTMPVRQLIGGGENGASEPSRSTGERVLLAPTLALLGLGSGIGEGVFLLTMGMADFVTGGAFDLVSDESADVAMTPMTPRFLEAPKQRPTTDPCGRRL